MERYRESVLYGKIYREYNGKMCVGRVLGVESYRESMLGENIQGEYSV